jgi:hypothetical protein
MDVDRELDPPFRVWSTIGDGLRVYRLLFPRSVTTAAVVYGAVAVLQLGQHATSAGFSDFLALVAGVGVFAGPLLVQGALVELVRGVHDGRVPERIRSIFGVSRKRFWPLVWTSLYYAFGVLLRLCLFIVPGLIAAARWSLMGPVVVLEGKGAGAASDRSSELVKGRTGRVLGCLAVSYLVTLVPALAVLLSNLGFGTATFLDFAIASLTAPLTAHLSTAIYYRLADPGRPVIDPRVLAWGSVWD